MKYKINAVLVRLNISIFPNTRTDLAITEEVKLRKALGGGAGKWQKHKLPVESLNPIRTFAGAVRKFHYDHTCVFEDGSRLLSAAARPKYDVQMEQFRAEFFNLVDAFGAEYPNWIDMAKIMHAATFEPSDYPSWGLCRTMFNLTREYCPVPKPEHFNKDMQQLYGAGLEALTEQKIAVAVQDNWDRLLKPVQAMAERLSSKDAVFRDSLVENVKEITALIPALNLTDDPKLKEAAVLIEKQLASLNPEVLRDSKVDRKSAAEAAQAIVARFGAIGQRKLAKAA